MSQFETITANELKEKMDRGDDFILVDTLGERSYQRAHVPGAVSIDAHGEDFVEKVRAQVPEQDAEIVVYCASFECQLSPEAAQKLADAGYTNVLDYEGGLKDWAEHGYDFEGDEAEQMKAEFADENQDENDEEEEEG